MRNQQGLGNGNFKIYPLLISVLITSQILCFIFARRQVEILGFPVNVSGTIFPLDLYLVEIIGECYSYEHSRQAVWLNTLSHILFIIPVLIIGHLPYPGFMHADLVYSYKHLIDISWIVVFGSLLGTFLGDMFSARYVPKFKMILSGKYIFLRLFICQVISEIIVTSSYLISFLTNNYTFKETITLIINTILIKSIIALILYPAARIIIKIIKQIEQVEGFDFKQDYKTLSLIINQSKIMLRGIKIK